MMLTINIAIVTIVTMIINAIVIIVIMIMKMMSNRLSVDKGNREPVVAEQFLKLTSYPANLMMMALMMMFMLFKWQYMYDVGVWLNI